MYVYMTVSPALGLVPLVSPTSSSSATHVPSNAKRLAIMFMACPWFTFVLLLLSLTMILVGPTGFAKMLYYGVCMGKNDGEEKEYEYS